MGSAVSELELQVSRYLQGLTINESRVAIFNRVVFVPHLHPRGHLATSGEIFGCSNGGRAGRGSYIVIWCVMVKDELEPASTLGHGGSQHTLKHQRC